jgi:mannonate dehydratase
MYVFPGMPYVKDGYIYTNNKPGFGIDIDEALAKRNTQLKQM